MKSNITTIGGGTGTFNVLSGLGKNRKLNLAAIVTVADSGGSTGELRDEFGILPPGDIRRAIVALSEDTEVVRRLFEYRFKEGRSIAGHTVGNLLLTALSDIMGDFERGIEELSDMFDVHGKVIPVTLDNVHLGVTLENGDFIAARQVVLALGHSARDTFAMLHEAGVFMEPKPFAVGFRIEHPQTLIDRARLGPNAGNPLLGAADYKLVHHAKNGRAVYSFCMCPGGQVVAATSEPGCVVTNGMSQYSRAERNANAGIVVNVEPADYGGDADHPLAGIAFQRALDLGAGKRR